MPGRRLLVFTFIYLALGAWFVVKIARGRAPHTGFTSLLLFGDRFAPARLDRLRDVPIYTYAQSTGYDGQFYSQLAVAGNPFDPGLRTALDSPAYRSRRILLPLAAFVAGLGRPAWVLNAYALANLACWVLLALLLARWWFPPGRADDLVRWAGFMFGAGMLVSVTRGLTDGPSLLLIAAGVRCVERRRAGWGAALLAAAGLTRETSLLAASVFVPEATTAKPAGRATPTARPTPAWPAWRRALPLGLACALPAVVWTFVLLAHYGEMSTGALGAPVASFLRACRHLAARIAAGPFAAARDDLFVAVSTVVQVAFLLARPARARPWWRVGAAFAVLALFLGWGFWEDPLYGVPRTLLPLALAFNVLAPRSPPGRSSGRAWALLVAGNLTALSAPAVLDIVPTEQTTFVRGITCEYASGWHATEHLGRRTWRWASGPALVRCHNPGAAPARVRLDFELISETARTVELRAGDQRRAFTLDRQHRVRAAVGPLALPPGDTALAFGTREPPWREPGPGGRALAFALQNLGLVLAE